MQKGLFEKKVKHNMIHQIYYDWGNGINELFQKSIDSFKDMKGCDYKLWNQKECEYLLNKYPKYKDLYFSCEYEIMKVDIIRFIILYEYGGLYADLDVVPVIKELPPYQFAVSKNDYHLNIEVLLSIRKNKLLLNFLDFVSRQIIEKKQIKIYETWKMRFVYQTTGPYSFARFLKGKKYKILKLNKPDHEEKKEPRLNLKGDEEFISYPSCSYKNFM